MAAATHRITTVRIRVAKSELIFSTPILPNRAVSAAKQADSTAQNCQLASSGFMARTTAARPTYCRTLNTT